MDMEKAHDYIDKNILKKLKSKYTLKVIFNFLDHKRKLKIINHNKNIQKKLGFNINDYKAIFQQVVIEMDLVINIFTDFIKIYNIGDKAYIHVYFNDSEEEIKNKYNITKTDNIIRIKIILDNKFNNFKGLFKDCKCIKKINFNKFNRNDVIDMSYMFYGCPFLEEINFNNFNTDNVTNMSWMFCGCSSLKELNFNNFNTQYVTDMRFMFSECSSLKELNLNNFNTINVTTMRGMFSGCISLNKLIISNFNTENVTDMNCMFSRCLSLEKLNLLNFNVDKITNMSGIFSNCSSLKELNIPKFNIKNAKKANAMFHDCLSLDNLFSNNILKNEYYSKFFYESKSQNENLTNNNCPKKSNTKDSKNIKNVC